MPTVSALLITHNEAHQVRECLATLAWCDEIVVIDASSDDATASIAREMSARVVVTPDWPGFGVQKQRALDAATGDWIVSLDADERLTDRGIAELRAAIAGAPIEVAAFRLPRRSWFLTRFVRHSGWWPDEVTRIARRSRARFTTDVVHERLDVDGAVRPLSEAIEHYSYRNRLTVERKIESYSTAGAEQLARRGVRGGLVSALAHGAWSWFRTYLLRLGVLDGSAGLGIAAMNAKTAYLKYRKAARIAR